jgi:uncharacterized delta-60 repeat protein/prepilin-type N-terminal cleavage/methylation domain-containing protein
MVKMFKRPGFTLVELLLTLGVISTLSSITIKAINPTKQLDTTKYVTAMAQGNAIQDGLRQATVDTSAGWNGSVLPAGAEARIPLCAQGQTCSGGINLDSLLVPKFLPAIPRDVREVDPTKSGFEVYRNELNLPMVVSSANTFYSTGILDTSFDPGTGADHYVMGLSVQPDAKALIFGYFTSFNGTSRPRIARVNTDGSLDPSFDPGTGPNNNVSTLQLQTDGKIFLTGAFTAYNGTTRPGFAKLNSDGSLDTSFDPGTGPNALLQPIVTQSDGKIIIFGAFTSFNGTALNRIGRLNANGSVDSSFNAGTGANNGINQVWVQPDGKILLCGYFTAVNGVSRNGIARLNADGSLDTSFDPGTGAGGMAFMNSVFPCYLQSDGKIMITGLFTTFNGISRNYIARLNSNGSVDTSFNPGTGLDYKANTIVTQPDGKMIVSGPFTSYNGVTRPYLLRLNADGSLDAGFNAGSSVDTYSNIVLQGDGKILLWSSAAMSYNGAPAKYLLRLNQDGTLDSTFSATLDNSPWAFYMFRDGRIFLTGLFTTVNGVSRNRVAVLK